MNRPKIVVYQSASLDGRLTLAPGVLLLFGDERWPTETGSFDVYRWLRATHNAQANLEGSGSLVRNTEQPAALPPFEGDLDSVYQNFLPRTVIDQLEHRSWFTVVDGRGRVRWAYKETEDEYLLVLVARSTPPEYLAYLQRENIPYLIAGDKRVDLSQALELLATQLSVTCVISTAGGKLNGALLRAGLVDEINIVLFPLVIGGSDTPSLFDSAALKLDEWPTQLKLISAQVQSEGQIWLRYQVVGAQ